MKMFRHLSSVFAIATIAPLALAATLAATPAIAQADQLPNPDWVALLSDYEKNYWQAPTDAEHGGKVLDADTMKLDEDLAVAINHKAAENLDKDGLNAQRKRALVDSDLQAEEAMPDALGPVLGKYMSEGLKSGKLNAVADIFSFNVASTYASKRAAMHPRPYLNRAESSYGGTNDLAGLPATLDIKQSPSWLEHVPGYSNLQKNSSYPSGHTTGAYSWGIALAGMIPELAPQIMARTSEAGNNRIVLGVHYPLDIMGGRIGASAQNGQYWHNEFASSIVPASRQLRDYLVQKAGLKMPEAFLKRWLYTINEGKFSMEDIDKDFDQFLKMFTWNYLQKHFIKQDNITVTKDEALAEAKALAAAQFAQYGMPSAPEDMLAGYAGKILADKEQGQKIYEKLYETKVVEDVKSKVKVTEKSVSADDFAKLAQAL